eukprot:15477183-Alexandrium_andersonii.AAC.1
MIRADLCERPTLRKHQPKEQQNQGVPRMPLVSGRGSTTWAPAVHGRQCATVGPGSKAKETPAEPHEQVREARRCCMSPATTA